MPAPQVRDVTPNLSYSSAQYDDPLDTYDSSSSYDGGSNVQTGPSDRVLVDVLSSILILFLPLTLLFKKLF